MASTTFDFSANLNNCTVTSVAQATNNVDMNSNKTIANNCEFATQTNKDIVAKFNNKVSWNPNIYGMHEIRQNIKKQYQNLNDLEIYSKVWMRVGKKFPQKWL